MNTLHSLYMHVDAICRKHPDAQRWRVSMREDVVEVLRRPILTSDVTLGALGIGNAPMPVPQLCFEITVNAETWCVSDYTTPTPERHTFTNMAQLRQQIAMLIQRYHSPSENA